MSAIISFTSGALIGAVGSGAAFLLWIVVALAGGLVMIAAWNALPEKREYL